MVSVGEYMEKCRVLVSEEAYLKCQINDFQLVADTRQREL
jgi:hypothetical protein